MKKFYPSQVIDLKIDIDHVNSKKSHLFEECGVGPQYARFFAIFIKHTEIKLISDGHKIT